jgi:hypothetical protein
MEVAELAYGLKPGSSDMPAAGNGADKSAIQVYIHRFKSLSLEGIAIANPAMHIIPDLMRTKMMDPHDSLEGDTRIKSDANPVGLDQMILGMDILHRLHLYIAYKEQKLYITPAALPPALADSTSPGTTATTSTGK